MLPTKADYQMAARVLLFACQAWAVCLIAAAIIEGGREHWQVVTEPLWWVSLASLCVLAAIMSVGRRGWLLRAGIYISGFIFSYFIGLALIFGSVVSDHYASTPLNVQYALGLLGVIGTLPLLVGVLLRCWIVRVAKIGTMGSKPGRDKY